MLCVFSNRAERFFSAALSLGVTTITISKIMRFLAFSDHSPGRTVCSIDVGFFAFNRVTAWLVPGWFPNLLFIVLLSLRTLENCRFSRRSRSLSLNPIPVKILYALPTVAINTHVKFYLAPTIGSPGRVVRKCRKTHDFRHCCCRDA